VVLGRRQHLELDLAGEEVVQRLLGDEPERAAAGRGLVRLGDVPAGEVRGADVADLPLRDQQVHRLPDLLPGRGAVYVVHLVEVDVVRLQATQGRVDCAAD